MSTTIIYSDDFGDTWTTAFEEAGVGGAAVELVLASPSGVLFAARTGSSSGLLRSIDAGATWEQFTDPLFNSVSIKGLAYTFLNDRIVVAYSNGQLWQLSNASQLDSGQANRTTEQPDDWEGTAEEWQDRVALYGVPGFWHKLTPFLSNIAANRSITVQKKEHS